MNIGRIFSLLLVLLALSINACSCKSQPVATGNGGQDTTRTIPTETLRNLIPGDSIPIASLSAEDRLALELRYVHNRAVEHFFVINNPFPRADSFFVWNKIRCNMSPTRVFIAEVTDLRLESGDLVWEGKLTGTGVVTSRRDYNWIILSTERDTTVPGGYKFNFGLLRIDSQEQYALEPLPPNYFAVVRYNPSKGIVLTDVPPTVPSTSTR